MPLTRQKKTPTPFLLGKWTPIVHQHVFVTSTATSLLLSKIFIRHVYPCQRGLKTYSAGLLEHFSTAVVKKTGNCLITVRITHLLSSEHFLQEILIPHPASFSRLLRLHRYRTLTQPFHRKEKHHGQSICCQILWSYGQKTHPPSRHLKLQIFFR